MNYDTFQTLWEDADCLYCKFYFKIQLDCHYFVRKFIVDVFIACFPGIWIRTVLAFPSHAAFQYAPLMQIRSVAAKWDAVSSFAQIRRLTVFVYDRNLRIFSLVCLKPSQYGIDHVKIPRMVLRNWNLPRWTAAMWWWNGSNSVCSSFNVASASVGNKQGSNEVTSLFEWFRSQIHERDTNFNGNSEPGVPAVIRSEPLLMLRRKAQVIFLALVTCSRNSFPSSPTTSLESMAIYVSTVWGEIYCWCLRYTFCYFLNF